jgi:hypothetical protein
MNRPIAGLGGVVVLTGTDVRTASGDRVIAGLALRRAAIVYWQSKLPNTAYSVLPSNDGLLRQPHRLIPGPLQPSCGNGG